MFTWLFAIKMSVRHSCLSALLCYTGLIAMFWLWCGTNNTVHKQMTTHRLVWAGFECKYYKSQKFDDSDGLTWDVLTPGHFDSGTFWLRTFWLWDILTLGHFDSGLFWLWDILTSVFTKKCSLSRVWLNMMKMYLGRFDSQKMGRFDKSLGTSGFRTFWLDTFCIWLWLIFCNCTSPGCYVNR